MVIIVKFCGQMLTNVYKVLKSLYHDEGASFG